MPAIDPLSPEVVYALKGNVKAPNGSVAATIASTAQTRINDAFANPLQFSGVSNATSTVNTGDVQVAS